MIEAYNQLFPVWGLEMGVILQLWEAVREASWSKSRVTLLHEEDLGIDTARLTGLDSTLAQTDRNKL
jgi:hypothetical protein